MWSRIHLLAMGGIIGLPLGQLVWLSSGTESGIPYWAFALEMMVLGIVVIVSYFKAESEAKKT